MREDFLTGKTGGWDKSIVKEISGIEEDKEEGLGSGEDKEAVEEES